MAFDFGNLFGGSGDTFFGAIERFAVQADKWLQEAFTASNVDDSWWAAVLGTPSNNGLLAAWMPVLAPLLVLLVAIQVIISAFRGSTLGMVRALAAAAFAIPATYIMVWVVQMFTASMDEVATYILKTGQDQNMSVFMKIFGIKITDGKLTGLQDNYFMWDGVMDKSGGWVLIVPLILMFVVWLLSVILAFVMSLRAMAIIILATMAGWAVVSLSLDVTKSTFSAWLKIIVGLGLSKPFAAGLIVLSSTVFNYADSGMQFAAGLAGLVLSIAMPFAAVQLVSFTAVGSVGSTDRALGQAASGPVRAGSAGLRRLRRK